MDCKLLFLTNDVRYTMSHRFVLRKPHCIYLFKRKSQLKKGHGVKEMLFCICFLLFISDTGGGGSVKMQQKDRSATTLQQTAHYSTW